MQPDGPSEDAGAPAGGNTDSARRSRADGKAHRNARKPTDRPKPGHAATGASELNMSETSGGEILKRGVQRIVHAAA